VAGAVGPVGGPSLPPGRGETGGRNIGPAARCRGRRREQKTALCDRWRQERGATAPQAPQRRPRRITTPSVQGVCRRLCVGGRPVSGKHERVPSLSGKLHAPGAARIGRAVQVSAANTDFRQLKKASFRMISKTLFSLFLCPATLCVIRKVYCEGLTPRFHNDDMFGLTPRFHVV